MNGQCSSAPYATPQQPPGQTCIYSLLGGLLPPLCSGCNAVEKSFVYRDVEASGWKAGRVACVRKDELAARVQCAHAVHHSLVKNSKSQQSARGGVQRGQGGNKGREERVNRMDKSGQDVQLGEGEEGATAVLLPLHPNRPLKPLEN